MTQEELARLKKQMVIRLGTTTNDEASVISNMVDGGSAGALPAVSASDNGKVLTVANGAWAAGNASGGGGNIFAFYFENYVDETIYLNGNSIEVVTPVVVGTGIDFTAVSNNPCVLLASENGYYSTCSNYVVITAGVIESDMVEVGDYYIEGGTKVICAVSDGNTTYVIPSANVLKPGTSDK